MTIVSASCEKWYRFLYICKFSFLEFVSIVNNPCSLIKKTSFADVLVAALIYIPERTQFLIRWSYSLFRQFYEVVNQFFMCIFKHQCVCMRHGRRYGHICISVRVTWPFSLSYGLACKCFRRLSDEVPFRKFYCVGMLLICFIL